MELLYELLKRDLKMKTILATLLFATAFSGTVFSNPLEGEWESQTCMNYVAGSMKKIYGFKKIPEGKTLGEHFDAYQYYSDKECKNKSGMGLEKELTYEISEDGVIGKGKKERPKYKLVTHLDFGNGLPVITTTSIFYNATDFDGKKIGVFQSDENEGPSEILVKTKKVARDIFKK